MMSTPYFTEYRGLNLNRVQNRLSFETQFQARLLINMRQRPLACKLIHTVVTESFQFDHSSPPHKTSSLHTSATDRPSNQPQQQKAKTIGLATVL